MRRRDVIAGGLVVPLVGGVGSEASGYFVPITSDMLRAGMVQWDEHQWSSERAYIKKYTDLRGRGLLGADRDVPAVCIDPADDELAAIVCENIYWAMNRKRL